MSFFDSSTTYACEYPGRACAPNPRGGYTDRNACSKRCESRRDDGTNTTLLQDMITTYSSGLLRLRHDAVTGKDVVEATTELHLGQRILTAPAAIVRGRLQSVASVILTLPQLLQTVEGVTDMPRPSVGEGLYLDFEDLVPREAVTLAATVRNAAVALPPDAEGDKYAVSVPYAVLPQVCAATSANAVGVIGYFPLPRMYGEEEGWSDDALHPAVAVYAVRPIYAHQEIKVSYGDCDNLTSLGLACARSSDGGRTCHREMGPRVRIRNQNASEARLLRTLIRPEPYEKDKHPNVYEPSWRTLREFTKAVREVVNHVQKHDPHVNKADADAIVTMWMLNTGYELSEWPEMRALLLAE